jgi:hypothetical protein
MSSPDTLDVQNTRVPFTVLDLLFALAFLALAFGGAMASVYFWPALPADSCTANPSRYLCQQPEDRDFFWKEVTFSVVWIVGTLYLFAMYGRDQRKAAAEGEQGAA